MKIIGLLIFSIVLIPALEIIQHISTVAITNKNITHSKVITAGNNQFIERCYSKLNSAKKAELITGFDARFVDSLYREERVEAIRRSILGMDYIKQMFRDVDSLSNGKRHLFVWVLPQERTEPNVRISEQFPNGSVAVFKYFEVNPYTLEITSIQY